MRTVSLVIPVSPTESQGIFRNKRGREETQSQRDAAGEKLHLSSAGFEDGSRSHTKEHGQPLEARKKPGNRFSPKPSEGTQPCQCLNFSETSFGLLTSRS